MFVVIVDGWVVAECLSTGTAGGILKYHGRGFVAEVLCEAQENIAQNRLRGLSASGRKHGKNSASKVPGGGDRTPQ